MLSFPKEILIETLRDEFSKDSYFHYVRDEWGFAKNPNLTDLPSDSGIENDVASRIFIGEAYKHDKKFIHSILVKGGPSKYVPISMSQNEGLVQYRAVRVLDGYNNETIFSVPSYFSTSGAWESQLSIDIISGDLESRDELVEIVSAILTITNHKSLEHSGVVFKPISIGSPSETDDGQGKWYKQTISCDIRTEWNRKIPIDNILNTIFFCVDFVNLESDRAIIAPNIEVKSLIEIIEAL